MGDSPESFSFFSRPGLLHFEQPLELYLAALSYYDSILTSLVGLLSFSSASADYLLLEGPREGVTIAGVFCISTGLIFYHGDGLLLDLVLVL